MEARQVGYRFKPTEEELVGHFLKRKLEGEKEDRPVIPEIYILRAKEDRPVIPEIYIYNWEAAQLFTLYDGNLSLVLRVLYFPTLSWSSKPSLVVALSKEKSNERECYCFCVGGRQRTTELGYWKETGRKRDIPASYTDKPIGFKRIFVYYEGRQPSGRRSDVVNHEYHLYSDDSNSEISDQVNPGVSIQSDHPMEMPIPDQSLSCIEEESLL
ncbi:protein NTM1-like 9 [Eucalyptus grandis]|uniref:protein NTM1-like 9 n=1 Tax=Eucalyptus grandis TaxID=71139 RepID=UPI00192EFA94|nr:protein NTM1-like 9 [Eucalyptus grandis]